MNHSACPSGLDTVGDLSWGAHFCHLYQTREDLVETLVPFFAAGLANNEQCLWVTAEPLDTEAATRALAERVPDLGSRIERGQIRIVDHSEWYIRRGHLDADSLLRAWVEAEQAALARGYTGLRLTGNVTFLKTREGWQEFERYESRVSETFAGRRLIGLCSYDVETARACDVIDVVRNHQFAVVRREGEWGVLENAALKTAKDELRKLNADLERRVAERTAQLAESERRFRELLDALPAAVYTTDAAGRITYYNQAAVDLAGRRPVLGSDEWCVTWRLHFPDGRLMRHEECPMSVALKEDRAIRGEEALAERPDGTCVPFIPYPTPLHDESGALIGGVNMLVDITERKRTEEALQASESRLSAELSAIKRLQKISTQLISDQDVDTLYEKLVDAAAAIMHSDFATMQMLHPERGSGGELHLLASRGLDHRARKFWEWVRADSGCTCGQVLRTGKRAIASNVEACDFMAGTPDREAYLNAGILAAQSTPLVSRSGELLGMISTHWRAPHAPTDQELRLFDVLARQGADLIERHRAYTALRASEGQLREADRLKDEFLAMLAHELRNPLASIGNAGELLSRAVTEDSRTRFAIDMIKRQTMQLTRLVDDLLDVARITQGRIQLRKRPIDLANIITHAVETVEPQLRAKQHRLSATAESFGSLYVSGDHARLVQCVGNVLTNAIKYTDPGGEIRIQTRATDRNVVIEISDNGVGIPAELLPNVFDLFVQSDRTLDRAQGGLGIGLAVVRRLVEMHDGEVTVRSAGLGSGATFEIRLPRVERPQPSSAEASPIKTSPRRVLIVDDNRDAATSLAALLTVQGHEAQVAFSGAHALERFESFQPEVALLDLGLPQMDGYELAGRLRALPRLNGIRLVALTGYGQTEDRQRTQAAGFDDHLVKPVDLVALERTLAASGGYDAAR